MKVANPERATCGRSLGPRGWWPPYWAVRTENTSITQEAKGARLTPHHAGGSPPVLASSRRFCAPGPAGRGPQTLGGLSTLVLSSPQGPLWLGLCWALSRTPGG